MKHVLLIGATDGIGRCLADYYYDAGWRVGVVGRRQDRLDRLRQRLEGTDGPGTIECIECDVRAQTDSVRQTLEEITTRLGQVDLVIYCAGVSNENGSSPTADKDVDTFHVNVIGAIRFLSLVADYFQSAGRGHLAAIGSIAGERGRKGNPAYCASKAALHEYLEGLRHRLHGSGVRVTTIKPGFVDTKMLGDKKPRFGVISPERAARTIARKLSRGRESFFVPAWWAAVALGLKTCPRFLFKRFGPA